VRTWLGQGEDLISFARAYLPNPELVEVSEQDTLRRHPSQRKPGTKAADTGYIDYPRHILNDDGDP